MAEPSLPAASHPYLSASLWVLTKTRFKAYQGVKLVLPIKAWGLESQAKCLSLMTVAISPSQTSNLSSRLRP